jgi:GTP-binding protein HflX
VGLIAGHARRLEAERSLDELGGLAEAAGARVVLRMLQERPKPDPSTFLGKGKVATLAASCAEMNVDVVMFDNELTPAQLRQIEEAVGRKIIDRTQLILDIFARRARTREGKLQVELAQLKYLLPRLVGASAALSRLGGGIGTRGPGETKLETDRRRIRTRIHAITDDIDHVRRRRAQLRERRHKASVPTVALVGYTNAGKTTLFNRLSGADVFAKNLLFATLDPTMRSIKLPGGRDCVISDTVGFVSDLPTHLVAAFRATLEEVVEADLIVHVRDIAHVDSERQKADVEEVLSAIGAIDEHNGTPMIEALNKIDELPVEQRTILQARTAVGPERSRQYPVSALSGEGVDALLQAIEERLGGSEAREVTVPLSDGATIAWLYRNGDVRSREDDGDVARFRVALDDAASAQFERRLAR